jgi:hypothetical protein
MTIQIITIQTHFVELKRDRYGKTYFLLHHQAGVYFAFPNQIKKRRSDLEVYWQRIKVVSLELVDKKVVGLKIVSLYPYPQVAATD